MVLILRVLALKRLSSSLLLLPLLQLIHLRLPSTSLLAAIRSHCLSMPQFQMRELFPGSK